jgi:hypothetical protein
MRKPQILQQSICTPVNITSMERTTMFPRLEKIPDRHVKYNHLLCQSHHLGAEYTMKAIMAGQTPLMSSSRGHKEQRGTIASNTPLPSFS